MLQSQHMQDCSTCRVAQHAEPGLQVNLFSWPTYQGQGRPKCSAAHQLLTTGSPPPTRHLLYTLCCLVSEVSLLLLAGDSSGLARGVDPQMDVRLDKVLHRPDSEVQPAPGGHLNWPALSLASTLAATWSPSTAAHCPVLEQKGTLGFLEQPATKLGPSLAQLPRELPEQSDAGQSVTLFDCRLCMKTVRHLRSRGPIF